MKETASSRHGQRIAVAVYVQNLVLHSLQVEIVPIFLRISTTFWTPHSSHTFLPGATMALGVP